MISFLTSAVGGSLLGSLLNLLNGWSETFRKAKETELQIKLMEAQTASAEKVAAWEAFSKSQQQDSSFSVPDGCWPWVSSVVTFVLGLIESLRRFTRPGLTWALMAFLWYVYGTAPELSKAALLDDCVFGAFTALFWWFGERYASRRGR